MDQFFIGIDSSWLLDDSVNLQFAEIEPSKIRQPEQSCNWAKHSIAQDVWYRDGGCVSHGCLSVMFEDVTFENFATVVHTPQCGVENENFSHCDIRLLKGETKGERDIRSEPLKIKNAPKGMGYKIRRTAWRVHIGLNAKIKLMPDPHRSLG